MLLLCLNAICIGIRRVFNPLPVQVLFNLSVLTAHIGIVVGCDSGLRIGPDRIALLRFLTC